MNVSRILVAAAVMTVMSAVASPVFAQATATLVGTVKDAQGGSIPGATVTLVSESRGTTQDATTAESGDFTFTNIAGDRYTVRVSLAGFKTLERRNVAVSPGDRVAVGTMAIEVGTLAETVTVTGEAPLIQATTGERSATITTEAVQNLPISNRNFGALAALTPGVLGTTRIGQPGSTTNFQIDGVSTIDTGAGGQALQLNVEAIAEVRVIASGYQAEYGRNIGLQITGVTKSGSNQFRGSAYDIKRDSDWNSNSWVNVRNGDPKQVSKQQDWGYTIGGPIGKPGGKNSWFFFYGHEYRPRTTGGAINRFRVPSLLERQGDFSQSTDANGALFNTIRDASTNLPCSATDARGCFQDGGVLGRIPQNRLYGIGVNVLKQWPVPNTSGLNYNLETVAPEDVRLTHQPTVRVDWQQSSKLRVTAKYAGQRATIKPTPGSIPGFNDTINRFPFITLGSATVDYTLTPTTVFEGTYGAYQAAQQGNALVNPQTNRCNIGLCDFPLLYPDSGIVPPGSYQEKVMKAANLPMYVNGRVVIAPTYTWGSRVSSTSATPNLTPPNLLYTSGGFLDMVRTNDVALSVTKLMGRHTFKAGYQLDHSLKRQEQLGNPKAFQGTVNFGNDTNNPIDSGFGFANAALGIFSSYSQSDKLVEGNFIYDSHEWYVQDNWKVSDRLSLDYGLRITHQGENYDNLLQTSNFFPDKWSAGAAPQLYRPGCSVAQSPCLAANRVAVNPITGASLGTNSQGAIGAIVPNSGNLLNGIIKAGDGIAKENYKWPDLGLAPRFGAAYDVSGTQRMVIRGGFGVFFDRLNGNTVYNQVGNPPIGQSSTIRNGTLQTLGPLTQTPSNMTVFYYNSKLPTSLQWNVGTQMTLPWSSSLDVSYVGSHAYNVLGQNPDINAPDLGVAYLPQYQDPTMAASAVPGAAALTTDLLRPYRGLANINTTWGKNWNGYDSIQTSFNRRFRNGVQATLNYTYSIRTIGNTGAQLRLQHNPDGSFVVRDDQAQLEKLLRDTGNRAHVVKGNFVWDLPNMESSSNMGSKILAAAVNDWQLSGVYTGTSGARYDIGYSYNANGGNVNITGSPSYAGRIKILGDTGSGCSSDPYRQFTTGSFAAPGYNSTGLESGSSVLGGCFDNTTDLSIARNIRIGAGGARQIQLRVDLFNAFNTVVIDGRVTQLQLNSPTDLTVRNPQFNADGTVNAARLKPKDAGFGAATSAQAMRTVQVQLRFQF